MFDCHHLIFMRLTGLSIKCLPQRAIGAASQVNLNLFFSEKYEDYYRSSSRSVRP